MRNSVSFELIHLNGWQVCCFDFNGFLRITIYYQAVTQIKQRKGIDRSKIEVTKTHTHTQNEKKKQKNTQPPFRVCCKHSRHCLSIFPLLLIFYHRMMPT